MSEDWKLPCADRCVDPLWCVQRQCCKSPIGVGVRPREPDAAMLRAARDWSFGKYGKPIGNDDAIGCWQAMFDAAGKREP